MGDHDHENPAPGRSDEASGGTADDPEQATNKAKDELFEAIDHFKNAATLLFERALRDPHLQRAKKAARAAAEAATDTARSAAETAKEAARHAAESAKDAAHRTREAADEVNARTAPTAARLGREAERIVEKLGASAEPVARQLIGELARLTRSIADALDPGDAHDRGNHRRAPRDE
jgi:hypothetical protein